ncbi:MAG TPA: tape measure protein [Xanthobacteraceae bacterium]|nr:tape measure protein [Xanthobacteraceae bacterium]
MASDLEDLILTISADTRQIQRALKRLEGDTAASMRNVERSTDRTTAALGRMNKAVAGIHMRAASSARAFAGGFLGMAGAQAVVQLADSYTSLQNALRVAGLEGEELQQVYQQLFQAAQRNYAPVDALVTLYGRVSLVQKELGVSGERMLAFTDTVGKALRVAGTDAQSASGALLQLSQALGSGVVRAEEFNSMLEGALPIVQAAAAGITEAGGSVAKLRQLVVDGKVSSKAFFDGIEAGSSMLDQKLAGAAQTVSQAMIRLRNVMLDAVGNMDKGTQGSRDLAKAINDIATSLEGADLASWAAAAINGLKAVADTMAQIIRGAERLGEITGANQLGPWLTGGKSANRRVGEAFGDLPKPAAPTAVTVNRKPVSLADYPVSADEKSGRTRANPWEREVRQIQERTAALDLEARMMGKSTFEIEKARMALELEQAAKRANLTITPQMQGQIDALSASYARAAQAIENARSPLAQFAREAQNTRMQVDELALNSINSLEDALVDVVTGTQTAAEAFKKMADAIIADLARIVIRKTITGPLGDMLSSGIGGIFGRAGGGPVEAGRPYAIGERGPEMFVPNVAGRIVPNHQLERSGGEGAITIQMTNDFRGADPGSEARIMTSLEELKRSIPGMVIGTVRDASRRSVPGFR